MIEEKKDFAVKIGSEEQEDFVKFDLTREEAGNLYQESLKNNEVCRVFKVKEIKPKVKVFLG